MTNRKIPTGIAAILIAMLIVSCSKDNGNPIIKFKTGPGFTGKDTLMMVADTLPVVLDISWNGKDVLETLDIRQNDVSFGSTTLSGENTTLGVNLIKGTDESEKWTFVVLDTKGNQGEISLTLTKDPNSKYGVIKYYASVVLGAQSNTTKDGFISFQTQPDASIFNIVFAFANAGKIDLLYYSDQVTNATLASPGSDIPDNLYPGSRNISLWPVRNISSFLKSDMTVEAFNNISTDAVIINSWSDTGAVSKAGNLKVDDIWLVKLVTGKMGAFLVKRISAGDVGDIELAIKIQE